LRICGFTKDQIKKLKNSRYIDITLFDCDKDGLQCKAYVDISEMTDEDKKEYDEIPKELRRKFIEDLFL
jgi:hypothetical protein